MPRSSPIINVSAFPEGARKQAVALLGLFGALSHYTDRFEYALRLFELSEGELAKTLSPGPKMEDQDARFMHAGWMQIAARDATMTLFHFAKTIDEIRGSLRYLPTLRPLVKNDAIRVSAKLFRARFPNYLEMRHTVAHSGETASLAARARDAVGTISMRENLLGAAIHVDGQRTLSLHRDRSSRCRSSCGRPDEIFLSVQRGAWLCRKSNSRGPRAGRFGKTGACTRWDHETRFIRRSGRRTSSPCTENLSPATTRREA